MKESIEQELPLDEVPWSDSDGPNSFSDFESLVVNIPLKSNDREVQWLRGSLEVFKVSQHSAFDLSSSFSIN